MNWREVDAKEFHDFVSVLKLVPMSGYSTSLGECTRFGNDSDAAMAEVSKYLDSRVYRIKVSSPVTKQVDVSGLKPEAL